jgi:phage terminase large subunit-like protein
MWETAVPDWEDRILTGRSLVPDLPLFAAERDAALRIFDGLKIPDVIGTPTMAEACGEWIRDIVAALFGSYDPQTNRRHVQEAFLLVPKKNSKTSSAAAIMVTAMVRNRRPLAEGLLIAPSLAVSGRAYDQVKGIVAADPKLAALFHCQDHIKTITHLKTGANLSIKSADTDIITGTKATYILIDETHEFAKKAGASKVFLEVRGGLTARPDGFLIQITTQSKDPPAGVFKAELATARRVRDGEITLNKARLAVLYELPTRLTDKGGWKNPSLWPLVNPNLNKSVDPEFLADQLTTAETEGKEALALLASQHFNVEVGLAMMADRWRGADYWLAATDPTLTYEELKRRCEVCVVGIDGGGLDDLLGLTVIGREKGSRRWLSWSKAWVQSDVLKNRPEIAATLQDFDAAGELVIFDLVPSEDGESFVQDFSEVADIVEDLNKAGLLPDAGAVGLDAAGVATLVDELVARKITDEQLAAVPQGYRLQGAILAGERKLKDRTWRPAAQGLMAWCVGNARTELKGSAVLITKQVAGKAKIDPLMAGFDAIELMARNPEARGKSVYETRGVRMI